MPNDKIPGGYILQPRRLDESQVMKEPPVVRELWLYLLRKVNWKDNKLPRGTGFFRFADIQNDLCWYVGFRKMKYSKPRLTKALRRLCEGNMTATVKATRGIVITILNYGHYQDPENYEGNNEDPMKKQRRSKGRFTIIKEGEEVKEEKKDKNIKTSCSEPEKSLDSEPEKIPVFKILLIKKDGEFLIFQEDIDQWQETFPGIDVLQTLKIIRQWNFDNPTKRKTKNGIRKHISSWMGKEQDKGGKTGNQFSQTPKATMVYQEEIAKKNKLFQAYLQDEAQNEKSSCGPEDVIDIEDSPETTNPAISALPRERTDG